MVVVLVKVVTDAGDSMTVAVSISVEMMVFRGRVIVSGGSVIVLSGIVTVDGAIVVLWVYYMS